MSMVPPLPKKQAQSSPYGTGVQAVSSRPAGVDQATGALTELKHRLESDPRPRYVVIRDGMDHGPFNAVELLQQIATHTFTEKDLLRDTFSQDERLIATWEEFAPFAEHARRHRDIAAEKVAIEKTVETEKKSTRGKTLIGLTAIGLLMIAGATWFLLKAGTRKDDVAVQSDTVTNVEAEGNLNVGKGHGGKGGHRVVGEQGGDAAPRRRHELRSGSGRAYVEEIDIGGAKVPADITSSQYGSILNGGAYLNGCGLPSSAGVDVCVAVRKWSVRGRRDHPNEAEQPRRGVLHRVARSRSVVPSASEARRHPHQFRAPVSFLRPVRALSVASADRASAQARRCTVPIATDLGRQRGEPRRHDARFER